MEVMNMEKQNKEKMNLSFAPDIKDYLIIQSEAHGMSVSAYLTMLVCNYRQQMDAMSAMGGMSELINKIENLEKVVKEKGVAALRE